MIDVLLAHRVDICCHQRRGQHSSSTVLPEFDCFAPKCCEPPDLACVVPGSSPPHVLEVFVFLLELPLEWILPLPREPPLASATIPRRQHAIAHIQARARFALLLSMQRQRR